MSKTYPLGKWIRRLSLCTVWMYLGGLVFLGLGLLWQRWEIRSLEQEVRSLELPTTREELDRFYVVPAGVLDNSANWNPPLSTISDWVENRVAKELPAFFCDPLSVPLPGQPWDQEKEAMAFFEGHSSELKALHHAAIMGGQTRLPLDYKLNDGHSDSYERPLRAALGLLQLEASIAAYQHDPARCRAAQKTAVDLHLAVQGQPNTLDLWGAASRLASLSATLERLLLPSEWTDPELASLQQKLCSIDYRQQMKLALAGECASQLDLYREGYPFANGAEIEILQWSLFSRKSLENDWPIVLTQFQNRADQKAAEKKGRFRFTTFSYDLFSSREDQMGAIGARTAARRSLINAGLAVHRFRLRHGHLPETLAQVDTDLYGQYEGETSPSSDPFDGHPLRDLVQPDRFLIYSIAEDQQDNGGDVDFDDSGDSRKRLLDIGFSVRR